MAFRKLEIASRETVSGCRAALVMAGRSKRVSLVVTLAGRIREEMGLGNGEEAFAVQIGEGEHHGILRIRKAVDEAEASLAVKATRAGRGSRGGWFHRLKLGHIEQFRAEPAKAEACNWEKLEDGWFEIVLPRWADETAPKTGRRIRRAAEDAEGKIGGRGRSREAGAGAPRGGGTAEEARRARRCHCVCGAAGEEGGAG